MSEARAGGEVAMEGGEAATEGGEAATEGGEAVRSRRLSEGFGERDLRAAGTGGGVGVLASELGEAAAEGTVGVWAGLRGGGVGMDGMDDDGGVGALGERGGVDALL